MEKLLLATQKGSDQVDADISFSGCFPTDTLETYFKEFCFGFCFTWTCSVHFEYVFTVVNQSLFSHHWKSFAAASSWCLTYPQIRERLWLFLCWVPSASAWGWSRSKYDRVPFNLVKWTGHCKWDRIWLQVLKSCVRGVSVAPRTQPLRHSHETALWGISSRWNHSGFSHVLRVHTLGHCVTEG